MLHLLRYVTVMMNGALRASVGTATRAPSVARENEDMDIDPGVAEGAGAVSVQLSV